MKIIYKFDTEELFETEEQTIVPSVGHIVYLDEEYFVEEVAWSPADNFVYVYLTYDAPSRAKPEKIKENVVRINDFVSLKKSVDQALKETGTLKRQIFSIREHIKIKQERTKT